MEAISAILEVLVLAFALALTVLENKKSFLSSNILLVFWPLSMVATGIRLRTLIIGCPSTSQIDINLFGGKLALTFLVFVLETMRTDAGIQLGEDDFVRFFFRLTFCCRCCCRCSFVCCFVCFVPTSEAFKADSISSACAYVTC